jgi:hypothetical protein
VVNDQAAQAVVHVDAVRAEPENSFSSRSHVLEIQGHALSFKYAIVPLESEVVFIELVRRVNGFSIVNNQAA